MLLLYVCITFLKLHWSWNHQRFTPRSPFLINNSVKLFIIGTFVRLSCIHNKDSWVCVFARFLAYRCGDIIFIMISLMIIGVWVCVCVSRSTGRGSLCVCVSPDPAGVCVCVSRSRCSSHSKWWLWGLTQLSLAPCCWHIPKQDSAPGFWQPAPSPLNLLPDSLALWEPHVPGDTIGRIWHPRCRVWIQQQYSLPATHRQTCWPQTYRPLHIPDL